MYSSFLTGCFLISVFMFSLSLLKFSLNSLRILITRVLNFAPSRLLVSILFSCGFFFGSFALFFPFGQFFFVSSSWLPPCVAELLCLLGLVEWPHVAGVLEGISKSGIACQGTRVFTLIDSSKVEVLIAHPLAMN